MKTKYESENYIIIDNEINIESLTTKNNYINNKRNIDLKSSIQCFYIIVILVLLQNIVGLEIKYNNILYIIIILLDEVIFYKRKINKF